MILHQNRNLDRITGSVSKKVFQKDRITGIERFDITYNKIRNFAQNNGISMFFRKIKIK